LNEKETKYISAIIIKQIVAFHVTTGLLTMKPLKQTLILISILLVLTPTAYADKNEEVSLWAAQTIIKTLSLSYTSKPSDLEKVKKNYSFNAWDAIVGFLGQYKAKIQSEQLTLHPVLESVPVVTKTGQYNGINFWYIKQNVIIPEFKAKIEFGMAILARDPASGYPYIIQSLNMKLIPHN
jgi:hypothetical protein